MTITLTPDIEHALVDKAKKQGTTPEQLALESLRERFGDTESFHLPGRRLQDRGGLNGS